MSLRVPGGCAGGRLSTPSLRAEPGGRGNAPSLALVPQDELSSETVLGALGEGRVARSGAGHPLTHRPDASAPTLFPPPRAPLSPLRGPAARPLRGSERFPRPPGRAPDHPARPRSPSGSPPTSLPRARACFHLLWPPRALGGRR